MPARMREKNITRLYATDFFCGRQKTTPLRKHITYIEMSAHPQKSQNKTENLDMAYIDYKTAYHIVLKI